MTDPITVHPDDLDAIAQRLIEANDATGGATCGTVLADMPQEHADTWRGWAQQACDGRLERCGGTSEAHQAARALARELAEARA